MRILAITSLYPLSADDYVGTAMHLNFRPLNAIGHDIHVVRPQMRLYQLLSRDWRRKGGRLVPRRYVLDGVPVECPRFWRLPGNKWRAIESNWRQAPISRFARAEHAKKPFDLIYGCELMPDGVNAVQIAEELRLPVMLSSIGSDAHTYPHQSALAMTRTRDALEKADVVLVEAAGAIDDIRKVAPNYDRVHVFSRGIDLTRYENAPPINEMRRTLGLPSGRRLVVFLGALNEGKGVRVLADAFSKIHTAHQDADLVFVGAGPMDEVIRTEAAAKGWSGRLHLLGRRSFASVPHILMACDVFCLPSFGEGLPKSVVEGMAAGLPVIATRVGGIPDVMSHGECGILIPPRDVDALADALSRLLANRDEAARMGATGRTVAYAHFDTVKNAPGILRFAEMAIARCKARFVKSEGK